MTTKVYNLIEWSPNFHKWLEQYLIIMNCIYVLPTWKYVKKAYGAKCDYYLCFLTTVRWNKQKGTGENNMLNKSYKVAKMLSQFCFVNANFYRSYINYFDYKSELFSHTVSFQKAQDKQCLFLQSLLTVWLRVDSRHNHWMKGNIERNVWPYQYFFFFVLTISPGASYIPTSVLLSSSVCPNQVKNSTWRFNPKD